MKGVGLALAAACVVGIGLGHALQPSETRPLPRVSTPITEDDPGWDCTTMGNRVCGHPYCMFDAEMPKYLTVSGPAGGVITVNGKERGVLVLITDDDYGDEVRPDAEPFTGILYNVKGPGRVEVDGHGCEST